MNGGKFEVGQDEVTVTAPERTMDCTERPRCDTNEGVAIEVTVTSEHTHKQEEHRNRRERVVGPHKNGVCTLFPDLRLVGSPVRRPSPN